jgi:cupin fold WbuC family metalloprotein
MSAADVDRLALRRESDEVYYSSHPVVTVDDRVLAFIRDAAYANPRRVCRLCSHDSPADDLHEMMICHAKGGYVRPHGHAGRSVSFSFIEGRAQLVLFDTEGKPVRFIAAGPTGMGRTSYVRLPADTIYTFLLEDDHLFIRETIRGPFDPKRTFWASWAPRFEDAAAAKEYLQELYRLAGATPADTSWL